MAKYTHFEQLPVWQEAARLYNHVLDLLQLPLLPVSAGFRNQLDRAALSISNNIAEGFDRATTNELLSFLGIARGSSGEVRSMLLVVRGRPKLKPYLEQLATIAACAQSCGKQLTAWRSSIETSIGKRNLTPKARQARQAAGKAAAFRTNFLRTLNPQHPLYNSSEAKTARGENNKADM